MRLITVDMKATREVDIYKEHAQAMTSNQKEMLERIKTGEGTDEEKKAGLTALTEAIDSSVEFADAIEDGAGPMITIGYIRASKITNINLGSHKDVSKMIEAARKICAEGVVGWSGVNGQDGKPVAFAVETMLDTLERSGLLPTVRDLILEYNAPTEEQVKK